LKVLEVDVWLRGCHLLDDLSPGLSLKEIVLPDIHSLLSVFLDFVYRVYNDPTDPRLLFRAKQTYSVIISYIL
jgi:hypothetical protein